MKTVGFWGLSMCVLFAAACSRPNRSAADHKAFEVGDLISNASGLTMRVTPEHLDPTLWLTVPGKGAGPDAVLVLLPEHVTVRRHGANEAQNLYLWRPGTEGVRPHWVRNGKTLEYEVGLPSGMHFLARASLESDGVLVHYEFANDSSVDFDSVQAVTDPRMISPLFRDVRLERTYVHEGGRFVLLASDMPQRVSMPMDQWLPNRYRISYSWPVEQARTEKQPDGITFFNARNRADAPFLATLSTDGQWIVATFSRNPGNLWTNPELTCQHADPDIPLSHQSRGVVEEKILFIRGTLDDVLRRVKEQFNALGP